MMVKNWIIVLGFAGLLLLIGCREGEATAVPTPTPIFSTSLATSSPAPAPTLNAIAAAVATQDAAAAAVEAARPTPVPLPTDRLELVSPDGRHQLLFALRDGVPYYAVYRDGQPVILPSQLGFSFLQTFDPYRPFNRVNHTLAKELALYVVIYSPLQMAADLIENYVDQPAFQFIRDVPVDWHETRVLHAQIGEYVTIVRRERDGEDWYLGALTNEEGRTLTAPLDFLAPDTMYTAEIYADGPTANWETQPYDLIIERKRVDADTVFTLELAPGGGQAIRFTPVTD